MNKGHLLTLAAYLESEAIKPNNFNLEGWASPPVFMQPYSEIKPGDIHKCGYTACAIGHALAIPSFNGQGFKPNKYGSPRFETKTYSLGAWDAVCVFFDLTRTDAKRLFSDDQYPNGIKTTKEEVAARIRAFVKEAK